MVLAHPLLFYFFSAHISVFALYLRSERLELAITTWKLIAWDQAPQLGEGEKNGVQIRKKITKNIGERSGILGRGEGRQTISPPQTTSRLASLADFFFHKRRFLLLFPTMRSLVPG